MEQYNYVLKCYATFIATSSRRFICIEVEDTIDYEQPIDYKQLYAQAIEALRSKARYWFTHKEEAYISST
ncbi:hypothetical protein [uncultured Bacteroides sp.]|uniref:hypothetical protein n=1 Tax=uncultured Bacteroides sp. TaxID=162156 RepID=UPI002AA77131|nr:hypothetical protein [uncultured Bacteroides sp.]